MNNTPFKYGPPTAITDAEALEPMGNRAERRKRITHRSKQLVAGANQNRQAIVNETIRIGDFRLTRMQTGGIWIGEADGGEGGEFKEAAIEGVIAKFYAENF